MRHTIRFAAAFATVVLLVAAPAAAQSSGSADFSKYVAIGDSLTAGWTDGGLAVQVDSFPALLYRQINGTDTGFEQPLISQPGIPAQLQLLGLLPTVLTPKPGSGSPLNLFLPRPYDNLGIPGADINDVLQRTNDGGGFFDLILRNTGPTAGLGGEGFPMLSQALSLEPTFMTVWVGGNDALGAATAGTPALLTPLEDFEDDYGTMMAILDASGVDFVVATVPDVTIIPFVNTIPPILINPATNQPVLAPDGATIPLIGPDGLPLSPNDKVLLTAAEYLAQGCGIPGGGGTVAGEGCAPNNGLPGFVVLEAEEVDTISQRVSDFNDVIRTAAAEVGAPVFEAGALLEEIASEGLDLGGVEYDLGLLTGGLISYDGVHPTTMGYAVVTNGFIDTINQAFGSNIPYVDLYPFYFDDEDNGPAEQIGDLRFSAQALRNLLIGLGVEPGGRLFDAGDGRRLDRRAAPRLQEGPASAERQPAVRKLKRRVR